MVGEHGRVKVGPKVLTFGLVRPPYVRACKTVLGAHVPVLSTWAKLGLAWPLPTNWGFWRMFALRSMAVTKRDFWRL